MTISALIPVIRILAHTVATINNYLEKSRDSDPFLNPGQTPFRAAGQPLRALALHNINWQWHDYAEDNFAVTFGDSILKVQR